MGFANNCRAPLLLAACIAAAVVSADALQVFEKPVTTFDEFTVRYNKVYASEAERQRRSVVFQDNVKRAERTNAESTSGETAGVTKYFDLTPAEFKAKFGQLLQPDTPSPASYDFSISDKVRADGLPKRIDWRQSGAVTPVPDQGECGSIICGFGFATNTEGVNKIVNGKLIPLSAQESMACVDETCGCYLRATYDWYLQNQSGWVDTSASWPYDPTQCEVAVCDLANRERGAQIKQVVAIPSDESAIQSEVTLGPVTVAVNAMSWQTYTGGVMSNCQYGEVDHVATIVGYNEDASIPYWILKNWWGVDWGVKGYIYLAMGTNQCNMTHEPLTVRVVEA